MVMELLTKICAGWGKFILLENEWKTNISSKLMNFGIIICFSSYSTLQNRFFHYAPLLRGSTFVHRFLTSLLKNMSWSLHSSHICVRVIQRARRPSWSWSCPKKACKSPLKLWQDDRVPLVRAGWLGASTCNWRRPCCKKTTYRHPDSSWVRDNGDP